MTDFAAPDGPCTRKFSAFDKERAVIRQRLVRRDWHFLREAVKIMRVISSGWST